MPVIINAPDAQVFQPTVELKDILGTWYVTHSTLPMWKSKKDVTITYTPYAADTTRFDDVVAYRALSTPGSKPRTEIVGVDTLTAAPGDAPVRFKWRGRGLLTLVTSRWQLLGVSTGGGDEPAWAVTFFAKTLFTPAGVDVYARNGAGLPEALIQEIKEALRAAGGEAGTLAGQLFEIKHKGGS